MCDGYCSLRKEVIESGQGVWFEMILTSGEREVVRLHRVNVINGSAGPAFLIVGRSDESRVREIPLSSIRGMRPVR